MPLYEYRCQACGHEFEALVRPNHPPACPACAARALERLVSSFGVSSTTTREVALKSGRRQVARSDHERVLERREVIEKHDH